MKRNFIISENRLDEIIARSILDAVIIAENRGWRDVLTILDPAQNNKDTRDKLLRMERENHPERDPNGYKWEGNILKHNGKEIKRKRKKVIGCPEGLTPQEYEEKIVIPNNEKYRNELYDESYPGEEFRPVVNDGRYFNGVADYGKFYEVSNYGRLKELNAKDCLSCRILTGYDCLERNGKQVHLNLTDASGKKMNTCPNMAYIVANAFLGVKDSEHWAVAHKNGNVLDNTVDNLEWVPKKGKKRN